MRKTSARKLRHNWKRRKARHTPPRRRQTHRNKLGKGRFSRCSHPAVGRMEESHLKLVRAISAMPASSLWACARCGLVMSPSGVVPAARKTPKWLRTSQARR